MAFFTLSDFVQATLGTLNTYERLEKQRGHIYNWYDIETLRAIPPLTISSVDSGNLTASLYTLQSGALDLLKRPLLSLDVFACLEEMQAKPLKAASSNQQETDAAQLRAHVRFSFNKRRLPQSPSP